MSYRKFSELSETGLLWLINRQVLHPRGFALALVMDEEMGEPVGWALVGDGIEPWNYPDGTENDLLAAVNLLLAPFPPDEDESDE